MLFFLKSGLLHVFRLASMLKLPRVFRFTFRTMSGGGGAENLLGKELSPYLRQHKNNPVQWFPWGPQAFEK